MQAMIPAAVATAFLAAVAYGSHEAIGPLPAAAQNFADALHLERTTFGTFMRATYTSGFNVSQLPPQFAGGTRALSSSIYQLYSQATGAGFPLHMLESDEMWIFHAGDPIDLFEFRLDSATLTNITVGLPTEKNMKAAPQHTVRAGTWIGALLPPTSSWSLTGNMNTPSFDPRDSHMAIDDKKILDQLYSKFPAQRTLVQLLANLGPKQARELESLYM